MRTKEKQEATMTRRADRANGHLAEDLVGMASLIVLLVAGLHLPLFF
jgi:hypothetical protein